MVFTRTKRTAAKVAEELAERGFAAAAVHGDLGQGAREQALRAFRSGKVDVLVATDVAARGIDVEGVTHVVNFQCPEDEKTYIHRIGRTGRAGRSGVAISFIDWDDVPRWTLINDALGLGVPDPVETYSSSAHLLTDLDIPAGTTGRLPLGARTRAGLAAEEVEDLGETGRKAPGHRTAGRDAGRGGSRTSARDGGHGTDRDRRSDRSGYGSGDVRDGADPAGDVSGAGRSRSRRRSRGGSGSTPAAAEGPSAEAPAAGAPRESNAAVESGPSSGQPRPRRRTRGGGSRRTSGRSAESSGDSGSAVEATVADSSVAG
jgi:superfamily II DNA/RNA helicase